MPIPTAFTAENRGHCATCHIEVAKNRFYCDEHRPKAAEATARSKAKARAQREAAKATEIITTEPSQAATHIAAAATPQGGGRGAPKAPTVDATAKVLGRIFMYITIIIAMGLVSRDPTLHTEAEREAQVEQLRLDEDQATKMLHPIARFITPTKMWSTYGGHLIANADVIDALAALYDYFSGLARYRRERLARAPAPVDVASTRVYRPVAPEENGQVVLPPMEGRVLSRHDLQGGTA